MFVYFLHFCGGRRVRPQETYPAHGFSESASWARGAAAALLLRRPCSCYWPPLSQHCRRCRCCCCCCCCRLFACPTILPSAAVRAVVRMCHDTTFTGASTGWRTLKPTPAESSTFTKHEGCTPHASDGWRSLQSWRMGEVP